MSESASFDPDKLRAEIAGMLMKLDASRAGEVDGIALSAKTKRPFKVWIYREALIWRMSELGRDALTAYENRRFASAVLLTRAATETAATFWYFLKTIESGIDPNSDFSEVEERLRQIIFGARNDPEFPAAVNVLKCLDQLDKTMNGVRGTYDILSEFAHPNYAGVTGLFARISPPSPVVHFGAGAGRDPRPVGLRSLSAALMIFEFVQGKVRTMLPTYIERCEQMVPPKGA